MKINLKNKKLIAAIVGAIIILPIGSYQFLKAKGINELENKLVSVESMDKYIKESIIERNETILGYKDDISKYMDNKDLLDSVETKTKEIKNLPEFADGTADLNERIDMFNSVNKDVDKMLLEISKDKEAEKDIKFTKIIESIKELDYFIDGNIKSFNTEEVKDFNEKLDKFPGKGYAEKNSIQKIRDMSN